MTQWYVIMYMYIPRVGIIKDDLIDTIMSGSVGPHSRPSMGIDTKHGGSMAVTSFSGG